LFFFVRNLKKSFHLNSLRQISITCDWMPFENALIKTIKIGLCRLQHFLSFRDISRPKPKPRPRPRSRPRMRQRPRVPKISIFDSFQESLQSGILTMFNILLTVKTF
jgi:hypothetical protein